ncbi:MAG: hypothetical protein KDA79_25470, partial [Planctomycetaceae bacterium]|nr:hypothetical protein [Planctomycetaceae bacterium]
MLAAFCLAAVFAFVAFAVDSERIVVARSEMQNAVDAAALAASQEITGAIFEAGQERSSANVDANSIAVENARDMAFRVAEANGVHIDKNQDVIFGKRRYDAETDTWPITWNQGPYNVVKVVARRDNQDLSAPDGRLKL